ncbi:TPA: TIGR04086 family membrane protein [bacterium]|nr:TIGR04086 family membrane protein [bacterium]
MKKTLSAYIIDFSLIIIISVIASLVLTGLRISNQIDNQVYSISLTVVSAIIFFIGGFFLGFKVKKRGLLNGFIFSLIYTTVVLLFIFFGLEKQLDVNKVIDLIINNVVFIVACLIGVNLANH